MEVLKQIVVALTSPLLFALLLFVISWVLSFSESLRLSRYCRILGCVWLAVFSQPYVGNLLLYPLEHAARVKSDSNASDYIHVLACHYNTSGNVSEVSRWSECSLQRNVEAYRLYRSSSNNAKIIVTGGYFLEDKEINYASTAAHFFMSLGVPSSNIVVLPHGTNTAEEVKEVLAFKQAGSLSVVSSATHMLRLSMLYASISNDIRYHPVDFHSNGSLSPFLSLPSLYALTSTQHAFYEYFAIAKYYLLSSSD